MKELEKRLSRLESQGARQQGPGVVFICGEDPQTGERSCDFAMFMGGGRMSREAGESQEDFEARVARAGGTSQVFLPEKEPCE